jgi:hypothetical protein
MKRIYLNIKRLFSPKINRDLNWSVNDFELAKRWASCRFHPTQKNRTIWEVVYTERLDGGEIIHEVNKFIKLERSKTTGA